MKLSAGGDEKQAESVVRALSDAQSALASKSDLSLLREHVDGKFALLQWMLAFNLALTLAVLWRVFG